MKKIDKKACQEYLLPTHCPNPDNGIFLLKSSTLKYVIRTEVRLIGHHRLLILYLYAKNKTSGSVPPLKFTMFQSSDTFTTYVHGEDIKTRWRDCKLLNLDRQNYYFSKDQFAFYSKKDEDRVYKFFCSLKKTGNWETGIEAISDVQDDIRAAQQLRNKRNRKRVIREKMKNLRALPCDLTSWLRKEVLPAYFFYDAKKGTSQVTGICSSCGQTVVQEHVKHNATGKCPRCGREFTMKSSGRRGHLFDRVTASIVQKYDHDKLIVRIIKGSYVAPKGEEGSIDYYEEIRVIVGIGVDGEPFEEAYHQGFDSLGITPWEKGYPPVMYLYQQNYKAETCGFLYCRNLDRELAGTPWQYCQLKKFYKNIHDTMQVSPYLCVYRTTPAIEFFVKLRLYWLVTHLVYKTGYGGASTVINPQGKNLREILQIEPSDVSILQQPNANIATLSLLQIFRKEGYQPNEDFIHWADQYGICDRDHIHKILHYATPHKVMRYLNQQFVLRNATSKWDYSGVVSDYWDYLRFCEQLHYDLKNEFVLFPKNLNDAHDRVQAMVRMKKVQQYDQQIAAMEKQLKKQYQFTSKGLVVFPPHTAREIVLEGHKLHHCVGGYVKAVADGECSILFLRKKDEENVPFYTVEIKGDRVIQVRGTRNCSPTPDIQEFLDIWTKKKHLKKAA